MSEEEAKVLSMDEAQETEEFEEDDENADESEDLEKRKQKINEFNVEGNQALNQINIQTLDLKVNYNEKSENERKKTKSRYDLQRKEDCIKFVENFKNSDYLATAIILCVFEAVMVEDFPWLMESLLKYLPISKDEEKYNKHPDSYIALDTILEVMGAQKFITDEGEACISLGINNVRPLGNIWEQFLRLRERIISWLMYLVEIQKYSTVFESYQMVTAFAKIIFLDNRTAEKHIFPRLYSNPENAWLLGNILFKLYVKDTEKEYWDELIIKWAYSKSNWLWKASYLAYALFVEHGITLKYEKRLKKVLSEKICLLRKKDISFIVSILSLSAKVRSMFCEILNIAYMNEENKEVVVYKYLSILRNGFYRVRSSCIEIPLLICDTKEQQDYLKKIIHHIMAKNSLQKQLFSILKAYIKEITDYKYSEKVVLYLTAYFCNMSAGKKENVKEIIYFLKECECKLAKEIYMCFQNVYQKRKVLT